MPIKRLPDHDYSTKGAYFLTICAHRRRPLFASRRSKPPSASAGMRSPHTSLSTSVREGIEEMGDVAALRKLGCRVGQGFYFARPLEPAALEAFVREQRGRSAA
jgi:hypothetical protein